MRWFSGARVAPAAQQRLALACSLLVIVTWGAEGTGADSLASKLSRWRSLGAGDRLAKLCRAASSFKSISAMEALIEAVKQVQSVAAERADGAPRSPWRFSDPAAPCLEQADSILDLQELLQERENVCKRTHLDKMEAYYRRYVAPGATSTKTNVNDDHEHDQDHEPPKSGCNPFSCLLAASHLHHQTPGQLKITSRFFSLYANQVSFMCEMNMFYWLRYADEGLVDKRDYLSVLPWLARPPGDENAEGAQTGSAQPTESPQLEARQALTNVKSIGELVDAFDREPPPHQQQQQGVSDRQTELAANPKHNTSVSHEALFLIIPDSQRAVVDEMIEACKRLEPVYASTVMPIVRLVRLGYDPIFKKFDQKCQDEELVHRWFSITLICSSILASKVGVEGKYEEFQRDADKSHQSLIIVDDIGGAADEGEDYDETINDQQRQRQRQQLVESHFKNTIEDDLWVGKYIPTRLSKLRTDFVKKISKVFKLENMDDHIVFRKKVADSKLYIVRIILVSLALVLFAAFAR